MRHEIFSGEIFSGDPVMKYRRLGRSGLQVSELSLGTMNFGGPTDDKESIDTIDKALDHGINLLARRIENEIVPMCRPYDLGIMSWSPLAQGVLAGRYRDKKNIPDGSRGSQKSIYAERITDAGIEAAQQIDALSRQKDIPLPCA